MLCHFSGGQMVIFRYIKLTTRCWFIYVVVLVTLLLKTFPPKKMAEDNASDFSDEMAFTVKRIFWVDDLLKS